MAVDKLSMEHIDDRPLDGLEFQDWHILNIKAWGSRWEHGSL